MQHFPKALIVVLVLGTAVTIAQRSPFPPQRRPSRQQNLQNRVKTVVQGKYRYIYSNGIPDHPYGQFPNRHNPNVVSPQNHTFRVAAKPKAAQKITLNKMSPFGVAINGVPFDPGAAEFWRRDFNSGWQYEALSGEIDLGLDTNNAHVQPNGAYHYHGLPNGLIKKLGGSKKVLMIGYAADGFPIYAQCGYDDAEDSESTVREMRSSYHVKKGTRPNGPRGKYDGTFVEDYEYVARAGDLDECNGRFGATPEYPDGIYHYYITGEFPFIPRYFRGTPDQSFEHKRPGGGRRPRGRPPFPPRR